MVMKRIVVVGSSGSGKSTLSRQLGTTLNLPVIHLDKHFWHPGWVHTPDSEWQQIVAQLVESESWIIDGNYRGTLDLRLETADTVVFLDLPRWTCIWRAMKRRIEYYNRQRPDMAKGCREKIFDPNFPRFLQWVWDYPNRARPDVLFRLSQIDNSPRVIWLRSTKDVKSFLQSPLGWQSLHPREDELFYRSDRGSLATNSTSSQNGTVLGRVDRP